MWISEKKRWYRGSVDGNIKIARNPELQKCLYNPPQHKAILGTKVGGEGLNVECVHVFGALSVPKTHPDQFKKMMFAASEFPPSATLCHAFHPGIGGTFCTFQMELGGAGRLWKPCPPKAGSGNSSTESMLKMFRDRVFIALARRGWWKMKKPPSCELENGPGIGGIGG